MTAEERERMETPERLEITVDGATFTLARGESLQALAEDFDFPVSFGCFSGRCGFCKVQVLEGAEHLGEWNDLERLLLEGSDFEDHRLACQCRPEGPVSLKSTSI